jgi:glutathione S-transferase
MRIALYDWAPSPFCLKIRAILDYKQVPYARIPVLGSAVFKVRRRGGVGKVPALEVDGRMLVDSTNIAYELDRLFPEPGILPSEPRQRALCHALEDWSDEALYFIGLYFQWWDPEGAEMVPKAFGRSLLGRAAYVFYRRRVRSQLIGQGTARKAPPHVLVDLLRELGAVEGLLKPGPFLLGAQPYLCDFALLGQLVYLTRPPKTRAALEGRPAIENYIARMRALREASQKGSA